MKAKTGGEEGGADIGPDSCAKSDCEGGETILAETCKGYLRENRGQGTGVPGTSSSSGCSRTTRSGTGEGKEAVET